MADFYAPQNPGLAAFIQPYLSWRERQANESRLADLMLPKAIPYYLAGLAYGTNPREPPFTSWRSTLAYGLPAVEALGIAPALRPAARGGLAAYGALERRMIPPAGQLNMMAGPGARAEILNQADPAVRAMITDQLKLQGLRDVQITDGVIRDEIARRNAVTMMGLPEGNTAADRAAALGFDTPAYHGTRANITAFDNSKLGHTESGAAPSAYEGHFFTSRPETAGEYAAMAKGDLDPMPQEAELMLNEIKKKMAMIENSSGLTDEWYDLADKYENILNLHPRGTEKVYPVNLNTRNNLSHDYGGEEYRDESYVDLLRRAKAQGLTGANMLNTSDNYMGKIENIYSIFDPSNIRSRFAAFDPARAKEADILAGLAGVSLIPALTLQDYFRQGQ